MQADADKCHAADAQCEFLFVLCPYKFTLALFINCVLVICICISHSIVFVFVYEMLVRWPEASPHAAISLV